ncbi:MAG: HAD-superfamily hydrolase [uncultured Sulfurovum sp.]|uniref:HAD-superfamily hydrolase n=1 Tax=uncultured Sulfurovum sp. TaxID=269237 RepID=A0A6S6U432_9BACT|nr:MAG: HAD-superfamily hydrolase [uncultured Sulfurovum sp.]
MQKLFITDLDHTFLHSSQSVSQFSKKIWNEKANHALLSIATARSFSKTSEFLKGLKLEHPLTLLDGAMVATTEKKIISLNTLTKEIGDAIIEESISFGIYPYVIALRDQKSLDESFDIPPILNNYQTFLINNHYISDERIVHKKRIEGANETLKLVYMGEESLLRPLSKHLKKVFGNTIEVKLSPENYMKCYFLTILHPLSDKAHALDKVHEYLNLDAKETTVFGDSINDIGMFKLAGTSIAVNNALDIVKKEATLVLKESNNEDAVAKYLQRTIKS